MYKYILSIFIRNIVFSPHECNDGDNRVISVIERFTRKDLLIKLVFHYDYITVLH